MSYRIVNEHGTISIDNDVIARLAGLAAMDCFGIVGMAAKNVKDGLFQLLKKESLTKGIKITIDDKSVKIDMHVVIEYSINISAVADTLVSNVKYKVEECVGVNVSEVNIFVEGLRIDS
jgi:uncharacterized alkaline shock family protein YloU